MLQKPIFEDLLSLLGLCGHPADDKKRKIFFYDIFGCEAPLNSFFSK